MCMVVGRIILLLGLFGFTPTLCQSGIDDGGLYPLVGDVLVLKGDDFKKNVYNCTNAWIIQLYLQMCKNCQDFAATWKSLAKDVKAWKPMMVVAAVDCADPNNDDFCSSYKVDSYPVASYPVLTMLPPMATDNDERKWFKPGDVKLIDTMVDFLTALDGHLGTECWPKLKPILQMKDLWHETKDDKSPFQAYIFEEEDSYVGREVILDILPDTGKIEVCRMLTDTGKKFGINKFPSLALRNLDGVFETISRSDNTRDGYVRALKALLDGDPPTDTDVDSPEVADANPPDVSGTDPEEVTSTELAQESSAHSVEALNTLLVEEPSTLSVEESSAYAAEEPRKLPVEEPSTLPVEEPSTLPVEEPSTLPVEEPSTLPVEEPSTLPVEELITHTDVTNEELVTHDFNPETNRGPRDAVNAEPADDVTDKEPSKRWIVDRSALENLLSPYGKRNTLTSVKTRS